MASLACRGNLLSLIVMSLIQRAWVVYIPAQHTRAPCQIFHCSTYQVHPSLSRLYYYSCVKIYIKRVNCLFIKNKQKTKGSAHFNNQSKVCLFVCFLCQSLLCLVCHTLCVIYASDAFRRCRREPLSLCLDAAAAQLCPRKTMTLASLCFRLVY